MNTSLIIAGLTSLFEGPELIIILVIILLFFGGSKLPSLARGLGKSVKEFKKASDMNADEDDDEDDDDDKKKSSKKKSPDKKSDDESEEKTEAKSKN